MHCHNISLIHHGTSPYKALARDSNSADGFLPLCDPRRSIRGGAHFSVLLEPSCAICLASYSTRCSLLSRSDRRDDLSWMRRDRDPHDGGRKKEMKHPPTTVMAGDQPKSKASKKKKRRKFAWKMVGFTQCSKECGGGKARFIKSERKKFIYS